MLRSIVIWGNIFQEKLFLMKRKIEYVFRESVKCLRYKSLQINLEFTLPSIRFI